MKWLGDGVMVYFGDPGSGVVAALELIDGVASAGCRPLTLGCTPGPSSSSRATTTDER